MKTALVFIGTTPTQTSPNAAESDSISGGQTVMMNSAAKATKSHFVKAVGYSITIEKNRTSIGRTAGNDITLDLCPAVSGKHACILLGGKELRIEDTSRNGTLLDGELIRSSTRPLKDGAVLSFPADKYNPSSGSLEAWIHFQVRIEGTSGPATIVDEGPTTEVGSKPQR